MVKVRYNNRLGNNMFQYALGRCIAEEMGYQLVANPLFFGATHEVVRGKAFESPQHWYGPCHIDLESVLGDPSERAIVLDGHFQLYKYYDRYIERIRRWFDFTLPNASHAGITANDAVVYVRLGDYDYHGWSLKYAFYDRAIQMSGARRIFIVTENPSHPFLDNFRGYDPITVSQHPLEDLAMARSFSKVIISCSTFAWWAALLASPAEVYMPIADSGVWSPQTMRSPRYEIDLRIDDPRYTYLYNSPAINSSRQIESCIPLRQAKVDSLELTCFCDEAITFHKRSKAYWFS